MTHTTPAHPRRTLQFTLLAALGGLMLAACSNGPAAPAAEPQTKAVESPVALSIAQNTVGTQAVKYSGALPITTTSYGFQNGAVVSSVFTSGTDVDDQVKTVILPFSFSFFGKTYTSVRISSNGWIGFDANGITGIDNLPLTVAFADPSVSKEVIAPYWDDLKMYGASDAAQGVTVSAITNTFPQKFIVTWTAQRFVDGAANPNKVGRFQAILESTGGITFNYENVSKFSAPYAGSATIGVRSGGTGRYSQWSFDAASINNAQALKVMPTSAFPPPGFGN